MAGKQLRKLQEFWDRLARFGPGISEEEIESALREVPVLESHSANTGGADATFVFDVYLSTGQMIRTH